MIKCAYISDCQSYRYSLVRDWTREDHEAPGVLFVMLNPSTADATLDDPTIRRCLGFAEREGCSYMEVVNLFAFRATSPNVMKSVIDPIGPQNDEYIKLALKDADMVICAWGAHGGYKGRDKEVLAIIREFGHTPKALGLTTKGAPRHPLYLKKDAPLVNL